jgi:hypothetical protein
MLSSKILISPVTMGVLTFYISLYSIKNYIGSVVAVAFQNTFHSEIHQNNIFFIFKKLFLTSAHQNDMKTPKKY